MRSKAALLLSLVLGVVAVVLLMSWARAREADLLQQSNMTAVLVATRDIPPNTILDQQLVQRIQVPQRYVQPKAIADMALIKGRVTSAAIPAGGQVLDTYREEEGRMALAYDVPRSRRAITIAVTATSGIGGNLRPVNFLDIFGTFEFGRPTGYTPTPTKRPSRTSKPLRRSAPNAIGLSRTSRCCRARAVRHV